VIRIPSTAVNGLLFSHLNICVPHSCLVRVLNAGLELVVERVGAGVDGDQVGEGGARLQPGLAIKTHPKKTEKNHLKNPQKKFFFVFLNFKFLLKIIQTFLFETDFYEQIRQKLSFIYKKIVRYALNQEYF
jgi:hypothetical protein